MKLVKRGSKENGNETRRKEKLRKTGRAIKMTKEEMNTKTLKRKKKNKDRNMMKEKMKRKEDKTVTEDREFVRRKAREGE